MALLQKDNTIEPVMVVVQYLDFIKEIGWTSYTGNDSHCGAGNPRCRPLAPTFIMWSKLPEVIK